MYNTNDGGGGGGGGGNTYYKRYNFSPNRRRFYVNGIDISHLFNNFSNNHHGAGGNNGGFFSNPFDDKAMNRQYEESSSSSTQRSIFVQKVTVSLEELYSGVRSREFQFNDGFFRPYRYV